MRIKLTVLFTLVTWILPVMSAENNAIIPVPKLENDWYDWYARHNEILKIKDTINPEIVLIGDSITHLWGGLPKDRSNGAKAWETIFANKRVLNMGFGWDRTQNVLWRLDNKEFDGLHPKYVVLNIGTNNFSGTKNSRASTPEEIAEGIKLICAKIAEKSKDTKIILMAIFPRGAKPTDGFRAKIAATNALIAEFAKEQKITFIDIGAKMLDPEGNISREMMGDGTHPSEKGYEIWAAALKEVMKE
jgi:lysophospholipase L1-like esterase